MPYTHASLLLDKEIPRYLRGSSGSSLLEWMVASLVCMTVALIATECLRAITRQGSPFEDVQSPLEETLLVQSLISRIIRQLDEHRLPTPPLLFENGDIRSSDGRRIEGLYHDSGRSPASDSTAIASLALSLEDSLRIERCSVIGSSMIMVACQRSRFLRDAAQIKNLLLLAPEGYRVLPGRLRGIGRCRTAFVAESPSLFDTLPGQPLSCSAAFVVPVDALEILYRDRRGTLRFAQLSGNRVIENQPVTTLRSPLRLHATTENGFLRLGFTLLTPKGNGASSLRSATFSSRLTRLSWIDVLLHL